MLLSMLSWPERTAKSIGALFVTCTSKQRPSCPWSGRIGTQEGDWQDVLCLDDNDVCFVHRAGVRFLPTPPNI